MDIPTTSDPWRAVKHMGEDYLVREQKDMTWISRCRDQAIWMLEKTPDWARVPTSGHQFELL